MRKVTGGHPTKATGSQLRKATRGQLKKAWLIDALTYGSEYNHKFVYLHNKKYMVPLAPS